MAKVEGTKSRVCVRAHVGVPVAVSIQGFWSTHLWRVCAYTTSGVKTGGPVTEVSFQGAILASRKWGHEAGDLG